MKLTRALPSGVLLTLAASTAAVSVAQESLEFASPCVSVTDDRSRLQCFDAQEAPKKRRSSTSSTTAPLAGPSPSVDVTAPATPAQPAVVNSPRPSKPEPTSREFGGETLRSEEAAEQQQTGRVKAVEGLRKGDYRIELDNGQIWAQTQSTGEPPKVGETITIRRAMLGSYLMSNGAGPALRVKRVQ